MHNETISSMIVSRPIFVTFMKLRMTKQIPRRFAAVGRMWCEMYFLPFPFSDMASPLATLYMKSSAALCTLLYETRPTLF